MSDRARLAEARAMWRAAFRERVAFMRALMTQGREDTMPTPTADDDKEDK